MSPSNHNIFEEIVGREGWGDYPAVLGENAWTYGDLLGEVETLAAEIRRNAGERATVGLMLHPKAQYIAALLGIGLSNNIIVPVNPGAPDNEKAFVLTNAGCRFLVTDDAKATFPDIGIVRETTLASGLRLLEFDIEINFTPQANDRIIIHTSGSTGRPKGVILSDLAMFNSARAVADDLALSPGDRAILYTPTAFAYAINQTLSQAYAGGSLLPWPHGMLFPGKILQAISDNKITCLASNASVLRIWFGLKDANSIRIDSVRCLLGGGQNFSSDLARETMKMFPNARIVITYGCTENAPRVSHLWLPTNIRHSPKPLPISRGRALDGTDLRVVHSDGTSVKAGEAGEIIIRGRSQMRGYLHLEELTAERVQDGWYHTGDVAEVNEEGELSIVGRLDNVFGVGHEKVAPEEVEQVIENIEGVTGVAVGHMPDAILEKVCCALVSTDGRNDMEATILATCRKQLSTSKIPRRLFFVDDVPRTLYGKIDRRSVQQHIENFLTEQST